MGQSGGHSLHLGNVDLLEDGDGLGDERRRKAGAGYFRGRGNTLVDGLQKLG
jgi:hypothetical protein